MAKQATVLIGNFEGGELASSGTGFVAGDGTRVVTNKHVVTGTDDEPDVLKIVFFPGTSQAKIVQVPVSSISLYGTLSREDESYHKEDLAFIELKSKIAEPLDVYAAEELEETMPVWAFGFPEGTEIRKESAMPSPTVHSLRIERIEKQQSLVTNLQLSGSPTHGNSGGPVILGNGSVVGVLQAKASSAPIIFSVPVIRVRKMLAGLSPGHSSISDEWNKPVVGDHPSKARRPVAQRGSVQESGPIQDYGSALNSRLLSTYDLAGLSARELTILRNEPFARRGYIFRRADLNRAFSTTSWYIPLTRNLTAVQRLLTKTETRNVDFIQRYQKQNGMEF